jgi:GT2 family glycosyltransferase
MDWPIISVIIPTYQREAVLCDTLASVLAQDYPTYDVIVVDQTQTHLPDTQTCLEQLQRSGSITLYRVPWASLPAARNLGIEQSAGDVVLFIDDDVVLPTGYLYAHAQVFQQRPDVGAVAGRVFDRMKLAENQDLAIEYLPPEAMDPGIAWYHIDLVHTTQPQQVLTARGCNMSFRRDLFTRHGLRFDERFQGSAVREESDFCLHIRKTGYIIWYEPAAHLVHLGEETGGCHDITTRSLNYQLNFYHNHFLLGMKNLTLGQNLRLCVKLFDCHVLGHPPCHKDPNLRKVAVRGFFYLWGWLYACYTLATTVGKRGRLFPLSAQAPARLTIQMDK